jgi:hypothetical protein
MLVRDQCRHGFPAPGRRCRRPTRTVKIDVPLWESLEDLFECDGPLQPSERRAQAVVDADTEREMLALLAVNVEDIAVRRVLAEAMSIIMTLPSGTD